MRSRRWPTPWTGRLVDPGTTVIVATSPEIKHAADRMGLTRQIEESGAIVAAGICFYQSYAGEMAAVADVLGDRRVHPQTTLLVATSPEIKHAADRMGLTARIEATGAIVAAGICFYQSYAGELAEANGWRRLLTNSAKLVNIIGGYGYRPSLATLERCVEAAISGRMA